MHAGKVTKPFKQSNQVYNAGFCPLPPRVPDAPTTTKTGAAGTQNATMKIGESCLAFLYDMP
jgi:hypothetical protein